MVVWVGVYLCSLQASVFIPLISVEIVFSESPIRHRSFNLGEGLPIDIRRLDYCTSARFWEIGGIIYIGLATKEKSRWEEIRSNFLSVSNKLPFTDREVCILESW